LYSLLGGVVVVDGNEVTAWGVVSERDKKGEKRKGPRIGGGAKMGETGTRAWDAKLVSSTISSAGEEQKRKGGAQGTKTRSGGRGVKKVRPKAT